MECEGDGGCALVTMVGSVWEVVCGWVARVAWRAGAVPAARDVALLLLLLHEEL